MLSPTQIQQIKQQINLQEEDDDFEERVQARLESMRQEKEMEKERDKGMFEKMGESIKETVTSPIDQMKSYAAKKEAELRAEGKKTTGLAGVWEGMKAAPGALMSGEVKLPSIPGIGTIAGREEKKAFVQPTAKALARPFVETYKGLAGLNLFGEEEKAKSEEAVSLPGIGEITPRGFTEEGRKAIGESAWEVADVAGTVLPVEKLAAPLVKGANKTLKFAGKPLKKMFDVGGNLTKQALAKQSGLKIETIENLIKNPEAITNAEKMAIDKLSLVNKVDEGLGIRLKELGEEGSKYSDIRKSNQKIKNPIDKLKEELKSKYKFDIVDGKIAATTESATRSPSDIRNLQRFIDDWGAKKEITPSEFLNMRKDLTKMSKFDMASGKTSDVMGIGRDLRSLLNKTSRKGIKGLSKLDEAFSKESELLEPLRKKLFDKDGTMKDNAISTIANLNSPNKRKLLGRLKKVIPDIEEQVNMVKILEDIDAVKGQKIGAYAQNMFSSGVGGFVLTGGNPIGAVAGAVMSHPQTIVPILKNYGKTSKIASKKISTLIKRMKAGKTLTFREKSLIKKAILDLVRPYDETKGDQFQPREVEKEGINYQEPIGSRVERGYTG